MANSDRPNHSGALEATKGKYAVYAFFTKEELEKIQAHCDGMRINMSKWMANLIRDELMLVSIMEDTKD
jgi:hypothetical protein